MVYNAMKLFMEVNPQLFDECSHEYTESQSTAPARQQARNAKWEQLSQQAKARQNGQIHSMKAGLTAGGSVVVPTVATKLEVHEGPAPVRAATTDVSGLSHERLHQFEAMNISEESVARSNPGTPNRP